MAKRTKKVLVKTKSNNIHPRSQDRGWLVLGKRWKRWGNEFGLLIQETIALLKLSFRPKRKRGRPHKYTSFIGDLKKRYSPIYPFSSRTNSILLILVGLLGIGYWTTMWWQKGIAERVHKTQALSAQLADVSVNDPPHPVKISISWYVDVPIKDGYVQNNDWTLFDKEAVYIVDSARPGYAGNIVIYGHNTREVMGNLRIMKGYEKIKLTLSDGSEKWYQVKLLKRVDPSAMTYLNPTPTETLTLYTCDGLGDSQRFIVQASPIESPKQ